MNNPEIKALETSEKWIHQTKAREIFVQKQHGILEMATGTGKTKTAIDIINQLLAENKINSAVITVDGTDLLDQWYKQMVRDTTLNLFRHYDKHKQIAPFSLHPQGSVLLISRKALGELFTNMPGSFYKKAIFVADEVHGIGSETKVRKFKGKINKFEYTLGLSATPDRAYDADGNRFIEEEIGSVIYEFKLQDAIRKGILCEFKYVPLDFQLTEEDRAERKRIIAAYYAGISNGRPVSIERFYTDLARVKKEAQGKIPVFKSFIEENPALLKRSIIFVETIEFGQKIQEIILPLISNYHTYFGDDDRKNLERFSKGEIDCLLAAKRISEGIDIRSVHNIILLTADRAKLQTIQRIGRSLRTDPKNPDKKATVVDFIEDAELQSMDSDEESELTADQARRAWLTEISNVGREQ